MTGYTEMRYKRLAANKAANELRKQKKLKVRTKSRYWEKIAAERQEARRITMERIGARI